MGSMEPSLGPAITASQTFAVHSELVEIQLAMVILKVRDLDASIAFYRLLGLNVPDPVGDRPVVVHRMSSGVSLLPTRTRLRHGTTRSSSAQPLDTSSSGVLCRR